MIKLFQNLKKYTNNFLNLKDYMKSIINKK